MQPITVSHNHHSSVFTREESFLTSIRIRRRIHRVHAVGECTRVGGRMKPGGAHRSDATRDIGSGFECAGVASHESCVSAQRYRGRSAHHFPAWALTQAADGGQSQSVGIEGERA